MLGEAKCEDCGRESWDATSRFHRREAVVAGWQHFVLCSARRGDCSVPRHSYTWPPPTAGSALVQQMQIYGVSFDMVGKQPIVLLKTVDGNRFLPIWIGHPEAAAILMKLQGASTPRPLTHDLLSALRDNLDAKRERVPVTELRDHKLHAPH